ncbi:MAG: hypothetical protein JWQ27_2171 [Ferruginibacter sp.]|nr:hypothetical protein [Ferruginibacter sp.]
MGEVVNGATRAFCLSSFLDIIIFLQCQGNFMRVDSFFSVMTKSLFVLLVMLIIAASVRVRHRNLPLPGCHEKNHLYTCALPFLK